MSTRPPRVHCYLRVSDKKQMASFDRVLADARTLADRLIAGGCKMGEVVTEAESAVEVRWNRRPGFVQMMGFLMPGDHLIIEAKDRLERDDVEMLVCLRWLQKRGILLHCLLNGGNAIDLEDEREQLMSHLDAIAASQYAKVFKRRVADARRFRKEAGFAYTKSVPWGHKRVTLPVCHGQGKPYKKWIWCDKQCELLREIVRLHDNEGLNFTAIGRLLHERGERTQNGGKWIRWPKKRPNVVVADAVKQAYEYVMELRNQGLDIGGIPFTPATASEREQRLAAYQLQSLE